MRPVGIAIAMLLSSTAAPSQTPPNAQTSSTPLPASNPFAKASTLPYQAPPFDRIKDADYQPAIEAGMAEQRAEVRRIADDPAAPTFDNTIVPLERSGRLLSRAMAAFGSVTGANTNDTLQAAQTALAPKLSAHRDAIALDPKLFARVKSLHDRRASLGLSPEQARVLTKTYDDMVRGGALLSAADKQALSRINVELSTLSTAFNQKLLAATKAGGLVVDDRAKLAGLSAAAATSASDHNKHRK